MGESVSRKSCPLSFDEHLAIGRELREMADRLQRIIARFADAHPARNPKARSLKARRSEAKKPELITNADASDLSLEELAREVSGKDCPPTRREQGPEVAKPREMTAEEIEEDVREMQRLADEVR